MNFNLSQKNLIYVLSGFIGALILTVIILSAIIGTSNKPHDIDKESAKDAQHQLCTTKACIAAANMILQNMDPTVDPCEDFNQFACGSFIKNERIPDDLPGYGLFEVLRNRLAIAVSGLLDKTADKDDIPSTLNAKKLYKSCMNETSMDLTSEMQLKTIIKEVFKGWPLLDNNDWNENNFSPLETLITSRMYNLRQIVDVYVSSNPKSPTSYVLRLKQPAWFFNKQYYVEQAVVNAYKEFAFQLAKYLGSNNTDTDIRSQIDNMFELEKKLANYTLSVALRRNSTYVNMTIKDLSQRIPDFPWKEYIIDGMFKNIPNVTLNENETILVDDIDYITNATKIYKEYATNRKKELKNLLLWVLIKDLADSLPKRYRDAQQQFNKVYRGTDTAEPRSVTCTDYVLDTMEYAAGRLYVAKYFNNASKIAATEMIDYIREEFYWMLQNAEWMDEPSRQKALEKADLIDSKIGYPDFLYDEVEMNNRYRDYVFVEDDFFRNIQTIVKNIFVKELKMLRDKRDRKSWIAGPAVVNAFYSPTLNQISFPAGILQAPFYDSLYPNYLNFGGIGSVIGHEITHGFDDRGRLFDKDGVYYSDDGLWTKSTIQKYKEKAQCIVNQYSSFVVKQVNRTLNGFQTQGENIADNGGVKESFYAYQNWVSENEQEPLLPGLNYTQNQLFFINYAQIWCGKHRDQALIQRILTGVHSPGEFRIRGPTSNFVEFAKAFSCRANTKNNPDKKCAVW